MKRILICVLVLLMSLYVLNSCNDKEISSELQSENNVTDDINPIVENDSVDLSEPEIGGGETGFCPLHELSSYVRFPGYLIEYVGEDEFYAWVESEEKAFKNPTDEGCTCDITLPKFIDHFKIPNDVLEEYYYSVGYYIYDWDMEMILAHDWEAFDLYCRNISESETEMSKRVTEYNIKTSLLNRIKDSKDTEIQAQWNELTENGTKTHPGCWTIADYVKITGIPKEELEKVISNHATDPRDGAKIDIYNYNVDLLYSDVEVLNADDTELHPVQIDALLHK